MSRIHNVIYKIKSEAWPRRMYNLMENSSNKNFCYNVGFILFFCVYVLNGEIIRFTNAYKHMEKIKCHEFLCF